MTQQAEPPRSTRKVLTAEQQESKRVSAARSRLRAVTTEQDRLAWRKVLRLRDEIRKVRPRAIALLWYEDGERVGIEILTLPVGLPTDSEIIAQAPFGRGANGSVELPAWQAAYDALREEIEA